MGRFDFWRGAPSPTIAFAIAEPRLRDALSANGAPRIGNATSPESRSMRTKSLAETHSKSEPSSSRLLRRRLRTDDRRFTGSAQPPCAYPRDERRELPPRSERTQTEPVIRSLQPFPSPPGEARVHFQTPV